MTTRVYVVDSESEFHLVEAKSKAAALRHVAAKQYSVRIANQKTLIGAVKDGVPIQVANEESSGE